MPSRSRHVLAFAAALLGCVVSHAHARPLQAQEQDPAPPRIRVAVEVIPVDVQVLDRTGRPVPDLGPERFTVTINGRRRRVVSAEQIRSDAGEGPTAFGSAPSSPAIPGRVIMIAVDCISFDATASRDVIQGIAQFVRGLQPDDHVGLSAYPNGAQIAPTTDHGAILRALGTIVGQRDGPGMSQFTLRPSDIIDISRDLRMGSGPTLDKIVARECGTEPGPTCRFRLITEATNTALYYEGQATASLGMLRTLIRQMHGYPGRKTLLLVSGGMIASDSPGGRPDLGSLGIQVGREAAAANTAIYTLFIDSSLHDRFAAETRRADRSVDNQRRDTSVLIRWLDQFAGTAGGALFNVQVGNAEAALARIHTELSSYYLLGVEPADEDRDGRTHEVSVKLRDPNITIRGRRWVMIPKRGITVASAASAATPETAAAPGPPDAAPPRPLAAEVATLAAAYERGGTAAMQKALAQARDVSHVIRAFRASDSPWLGDRKRTAIFALQLGLAGLRGDTQDARDEGGRLLAEYHVRVREPAGADEFECWWFITEASALQGLFSPETALSFIPRALQRCPASARLHLAYAVVSEQQWLRGTATAAEQSEIVSRYEQAMKFPEIETEARVRAARFLLGLGQVDRGLTVLDGIRTLPADPEVRYFVELFRGLLLRAAGRLDEAAAAFRAALAVWPGAQSAQVALMTLFITQGKRHEAAALSDAVQTAPLDQYDPWWMYWLGDYRVYPATLDRLQELGR